MKNATKLAKSKKPAQVVSIQLKEGTKTTLEFVNIKREFTLKHGNGALFRLSDLPNGIPNPRDLENPVKMFSTVTTFAWAMLPKALWAEFPRPIDFALLVSPDEVAPVLKAVSNALIEYSERSPEKNGLTG